MPDWRKISNEATADGCADKGLRPIQIWVPDVLSLASKDEAHRQSLAVATASLDCLIAGPAPAAPDPRSSKGCFESAGTLPSVRIQATSPGALTMPPDQVANPKLRPPTLELILTRFFERLDGDPTLDNAVVARVKSLIDSEKTLKPSDFKDAFFGPMNVK
jgi:hypothetical protein